MLAGMKTKRTPTSAVAIAACRVDLGRTASSEVRLVPAGNFRAKDGRPHEVPTGWRLNQQLAERIIARSSLRADQLVIDYEHQTLNSETNGQPAPAAGWIDQAKLEWRDDGLWATNVTWTAAAKAAIEADEYRYLSPVMLYNLKTGDVLDIQMAALTNYAAIDGLHDLAARAAARFSFNQPQPEDSTVDRDELIKLLGLKADASDEAIQVALKAATGAQAQLAALRGELAIGEDDEPKAAIAALKAKATSAAPDMTQFVPKAVHDETRTQLAALKANSETSEVERLIKEGMDDGRIAGKATADWLRTQGLVALKAHLDDAPSLAALKGIQTKGKPPEGDDKDGELSEAELAVCKNMGIDPKAYKETNA